MKISCLSTIILIWLFSSCNNPSRKEFPVCGIDVSHHQGIIDWEKVKQQGVTFVFIKATEGGDFKDKHFRHNWEAVNNLRFTAGAYHFFRYCTEPDSQANNFISTLKLKPGNLPPVIDIESGGNCKEIPEKKILLEMINRFLSIIEKNYGAKPIIYSTASFYNKHLSGEFPDYKIWIRNVFFRPKLPDGKDWVFWQYKVGPLQGVKGEVDLNVFKGEEKDLLGLCLKKPK